MLLVLLIARAHSCSMLSSLPARMSRAFSTEVLPVQVFPNMYHSEGFLSFPFVLVQFHQVHVGLCLQPVEVPVDSSLPLSVLTTISRLIFANLMRVCSITSSWSLVFQSRRSEIMYLLVTLEYQSPSWKSGAFHGGRGSIINNEKSRKLKRSKAKSLFTASRCLLCFFMLSSFVFLFVFSVSFLLFTTLSFC